MLTRRHFAAGLAAVPLLGTPYIARATEKPKKIRIGVAEAGLGGRPFSFGSTISVVHVQGLLEQEFSADGIGIEWNFYSGAGPAVNEALANSALDFAWQGDLPAFVARSRGLQTRQLWIDGNRLPVFIAVKKDSPINNVADLKGRTVANFQGTSLELAVDRILAANHLTETDLHIVNLDQIIATEAVAQGQIDATFLAFGLSPQAARQLKVIYHAGAATPVFTMQTSVLGTAAFTSAYPDIVNRVARVSVRAAHWAAQPQNLDALYDIWGKSGYPAAMLREAYPIDNLHLFTSPLWDEFQIAQLARSAADAYKDGLIRTPVDVASWVDHTPLDSALMAEGLAGYWPRYAADGTTKLSS